jgi:hypothetical protein
MGRYEPAVYAQDQDDAFKLCGSFEEACAALAEMVRWFVLRLRVQLIESEEDDRRACRFDLPEPGRLDMRSMDVYGLGQGLPDEDYYDMKRRLYGPSDSQPQGDSE